MHIANIKTCDIANGPGVRTSLFVSGCTHHCPGCFNAVAWDFDYGEVYTEKTKAQILDTLRPDFIDGISLLGGEPMEPENQGPLLELLRTMHAEMPGKTVWCYSGYTFEELTGQVPSRSRCACTDEFLEQIDVLVDGRFVEEKRDISLRFRGSSNQRLLDLKASLKEGKPVWWRDDPLFETHQMI
ncbi:MAG: anaerobic ribonucleoside-triphosphate reductase activating protein [Clostridia bacterium]|nr:anaerobic ribonucleoside-triphosphate reductase activating protein [Clostridia bacterium]